MRVAFVSLFFLAFLTRWFEKTESLVLGKKISLVHLMRVFVYFREKEKD